MSKERDFDAVFAALKKILKPHERRMAVSKDGRAGYCLESKAPGHKGRPLMFGAIQINKNYVSYHLVPIYMNVALQRTSLSASLVLDSSRAPFR